MAINGTINTICVNRVVFLDVRSLALFRIYNFYVDNGFFIFLWSRDANQTGAQMSNKLQFNRYDFVGASFEPELTQDELQHLADIANEVLETRLKFAKLIYVRNKANEDFISFGTEVKDATHTALVINMQELPPQPCAHAPISIIDYLVTARHSAASLLSNATCKHCGVKLQATWTVADE